jgi:hypothetical protein
MLIDPEVTTVDPESLTVISGIEIMVTDPELTTTDPLIGDVPTSDTDPDMV